MSPEQLAMMSQQSGHRFDPSDLADMQRAMASMTPEQMEQMAKIAAAGPPTAADPATAMQMAEMMQKNPDMMKAAAQMMQNLPPEQVQAAMAQAGMSPGMQISPDMMAAAAEAVSKMRPEDLQQMAQMAANMPPPGRTCATSPPASTPAIASTTNNRVADGLAATATEATLANMQPSTTSGVDAVPPSAAPAVPANMPAGMPDMSAMMNPEMMKMAAEMMSKMKPEDIAAMSQMMGAGPGATAGQNGAGLPGTAETYCMCKQFQSSNPTRQQLPLHTDVRCQPACFLAGPAFPCLYAVPCHLCMQFGPNQVPRSAAASV
eukprot:GHRR01028551.1.p1 GENE.GHRR01028551.1~~GHRR01028551.1.p1  ORF type:complete len:368 (+),score=128.96 GHRR01028551.1:149-1105(+)